MTVTVNGAPVSTLAGAVIWRCTGSAGRVVVPVMSLLLVSVTVMVCVPAVRRVVRLVKVLVPVAPEALKG